MARAVGDGISCYSGGQQAMILLASISYTISFLSFHFPPSFPPFFSSFVSSVYFFSCKECSVQTTYLAKVYPSTKKLRGYPFPDLVGHIVAHAGSFRPEWYCTLHCDGFLRKFQNFKIFKIACLELILMTY